jgi:hypothetical protein
VLEFCRNRTAGRAFKKNIEVDVQNEVSREVLLPNSIGMHSSCYLYVDIKDCRQTVVHAASDVEKLKRKAIDRFSSFVNQLFWITKHNA